MKTAIITGASAGLGIEFFNAVELLCPDISEVWVIARRLEKLQELKSNSGKTIKAISCDLNSDDGLHRLSDTLAAEKPEVALLINNAGFGKLGPVEAIDPFVQRNIVSLNCGALTAVTAMTLPYMKSGAAILNVASIAAFQPNINMTTYSSSKAYVLAFSRGLRRELKGRGINVFAVCPGPMETEFLGVAGIKKGSSAAFDTLPRCNPSLVAQKSVRLARAGRGVYTNKFVYKLYRVLTKILPQSLTMSWGKC